MPCACQIPVPDYPSTADWGPILWNLLHGITLKAGRSPLLADELREWQKLLKATGEILPCEHCTKHYHEYSQKHPFTHLTKLSKTEIKSFVTEWYFNLHNEVNASHSKPLFNINDLEATYVTVSLQDQLWRLDPVMKRAIQLSGVSLLKWNAWIHSFKMLQSMIL